MKDTLIKSFFMGVIAPCIIIGGFIFGVDYIAKTYTPQIINNAVRIFDSFLNPQLSEMNIKAEVAPPTDFYGIKFGDSKDMLLKEGLIVKERGNYNIPLGDLKIILGKEVDVSFMENQVTSISFFDGETHEWMYAMIHQLLTEKYGIPDSKINIPSSLLDIIAPTDKGENKCYGFGCVSSTWSFPDHDIDILLTWSFDILELNWKHVLQQGIEKHGYRGGMVGLYYYKNSANVKSMNEYIDSLVY